MSAVLIVLNTVEILLFPVIVFAFALPKMFRYIKRSKGTFVRRFYLPARGVKPGGLWFQASSVGEVRIAVDLAGKLNRAMRPLYLFAMTPEGRLLGKESGAFDGSFMAPADIFFIVRGFLKKVRPRRLILIELQLWPNLIDQASRFAKIILVNGRISDRSFPKYMLIKRFTKKLFEKISFISARTLKDAARFALLGADRRKMGITGNVKYDILASGGAGGAKREEFSIPEDVFVITAGSTHGIEDEMIVDAVLSLGDGILCVIAPRHVERAGEIEKMLRKRGVKYSLFSRTAGIRPGDRFLIVDVFGVLPRMYSVADVCFVGGSLVPHGGQNFIEAVNFGKAVVVGPYNGNFRQEFSIFREDLSVVEDTPSLKKAFERLMNSPAERNAMASAALKKLKTLTGSLERTAEIIAEN